MVQFEGYQLLRIPFAQGSPFRRHILAKKHVKTKDDSLPTERTLFITSLDEFQTEASLKKAFEAFGKVEAVHLKKIEKAGAIVVLAHVIFVQKGVADKVLKDGFSECSLNIPTAGRKKWQTEAAKKVRDPEKLQIEIDQWMASYDASEAAKNEDTPEVDEDGFTIVKAAGGTEGNHTIKSFRQRGINTGAFDLGKDEFETKKNKRMPKEKEDFYRFQFRAKRAEEVKSHRETRKRDLASVADLTKTKKFKSIIEA